MTASSNDPTWESSTSSTPVTMPKLAAALVKAQAEMGVVGKDAKHEFFKYKYATLDSFVKAVLPVMKANGLAVTCSVDAVVALDTRKNAKGKDEFPVLVRGVARLLHTSGESLSIGWQGEGQDGADKGVYKAITGGRKYALACMFNLATSDDPEADPKVGVDDAPKAKPRPTSAREDGGAAQAQLRLNDFRARKVQLYKTLVAKRGEPNSSMTGQEVMIGIIEQELGKKTIDTEAELTKVANAINNGDYELDEAMKLPGT